MNDTSLVRKTLVVAFGSTLLLACSSGWRNAEDFAWRDAGADAGVPGFLVNTAAETSAESCSSGGVRIELGVDMDGDGKLGPDEVQKTVTLCHGEQGKSALAETVSWEGSQACPGGGIQLRTGLDENGDGRLDEDEILQEEKVCFGDLGAGGYRTAIWISELPPGPRCASGGVQIAHGIDGNQDGQLSEEEIEQSAVLCHSEKGDDGYSSLTIVDANAAAGCGADGGQRIRTGLDNGDGGGIAHNQALEEGEVDSTTYVCDGSTGPAGPAGPSGSASLIRVEQELGGPHCPYSGSRILTGIDDNGDGVLTGGEAGEGEVDAVAIICSSLPGPCAEGYHDGGDLRCIPIGQCAESYHDDGYGDCVAAGLCGLGFTWDGSAACFSRLPITFIPAGSFPRGGQNIHITRPFAMTVTEVTQGQWKDIAGGTNPSSFVPCGNDCPVERADWYSAIAYANALSIALSLPACYVLEGCADPTSGWQDGLHFGCTSVRFDEGLDCLGFRLPTEAEWEYAYRAQTTTDYYQGSWSGAVCDDALAPLAWYSCNSGNNTHVVAEKRPNAWGLFDMSGNVAEWVWDWSGSFDTHTQDPFGPANGTQKVLRGGSWGDSAGDARATSRSSNSPTIPLSRVGFRLVRTLPE